MSPTYGDLNTIELSNFNHNVRADGHTRDKQMILLSDMIKVSSSLSGY